MTNEEKAKQLAHFVLYDNSYESMDRNIYDKCIEMAQWKEKQVLKKTLKWFQENLQLHTDWTGTRIETRFKCESLDELFNLFKKSIE